MGCKDKCCFEFTLRILHPGGVDGFFKEFPYLYTKDDLTRFYGDGEEKIYARLRCMRFNRKTELCMGRERQDVPYFCKEAGVRYPVRETCFCYRRVHGQEIVIPTKKTVWQRAIGR